MRRFLLVLLLAVAAVTVGACSAADRAPTAPVVSAPESRPARAVATDPAFDHVLDMIIAGQYQQAAAALEQLSGAYEVAKEPRRASESLFWLGFCKEKTGNPGEAARCYRRVMEKYSQTEAARLAQDRIDGLGP